MKTSKSYILLIIVLISSFIQGQELSKQPTTLINEVMEKHEKNGFNGSVLIAKEGTVVLNKGYGFSNKEEGIRANPATLYDIGSITKDFTKVGILKLVEKSKIELDSTISKYLKNVPQDKRKITVRQLLYHTSGLPEYHGSGGDFQEMTKEEALAIIWNLPLNSNPGTEFNYSNPGYTLLAAIIEKTSGETYTDFIRNKIVKPCNLQKTDFYRSEHWSSPEVAVGYNGKKMGKINSPLYWPKIQWALMGSGGLVSSTEEYFHWLECVKKGQIIDKKMVADHISLFSTAAGGNDYGYSSMSMSRHNGQTIIVFSNEKKVTNILLELINKLDSIYPLTKDPVRTEKINQSVQEMVIALNSDSPNALEDYAKNNVNPVMLMQIPAEVFAHELSKLKTKKNQIFSLGDIQEFENSIYSVLLKVEGTDDETGVMLFMSPDKPHKINFISI